jgi:alpha-glucosidase
MSVLKIIVLRLWLCAVLSWFSLQSVTCGQAAEANSWSVASPDGEIKLLVRLEPGGAARGLRWRVEHHGSRIITDSPMGLKLRGQDLAQGLAFDGAEAPVRVNDQYQLAHGKRRNCAHIANQLTLRFRGAGGLRLELDLRACNNAAAFRYRVKGEDFGSQIVESEETGFGLPQDAKMWCAPSDKPGAYSPAYETYYESEMAAGTPSPSGFGWSFPLLFRTGDSRHWALITEANVGPTYCGCRLSNNPQNGIYTVAFPAPAEGNRTGSANPSSSLPWEMPWRVVVLGNSLGAIVESTLVTDLSTPSRVEDTSWIKPGRVAWSWWSDQPSPKDAFVDFAAEMGWEYVLVDANWTIMEKGNIHDVIRHAAEKGVGVLLWYNSGGPHNIVTEKPRDCFTYDPVRRFELDMLKQWGVKGVKVDFFQSDKQNIIGLYHAIMRDAADRKIMVNFHGCTLPRGWERTYPNLMSMEAVRGEECYIFDSQYPDRAPVQNCILPFTRNAVGPMDYTPVGFSNNNNHHKTTWTHELALPVIFETGWLHFADSVASYRSLPPEPKQFLKEVPVAWDDTRFIEGYPGKYVALARRHGETWYFAGINGEKTDREIQVKPGDWIGKSSFNLTLIQDGESANQFNSSTSKFEPGQAFSVKLLPFGGFVAILKP